MNHPRAEALREISDSHNLAYGRREVETLQVFPTLQTAAELGQPFYSFRGQISGHGVKYLESLGYSVSRDASSFVVAFRGS